MRAFRADGTKDPIGRRSTASAGHSGAIASKLLSVKAGLWGVAGVCLKRAYAATALLSSRRKPRSSMAVTASFARVMLTMSVNDPSGRRTRHMPG